MGRDPPADPRQINARTVPAPGTGGGGGGGKGAGWPPRGSTATPRAARHPAGAAGGAGAASGSVSRPSAGRRQSGAWARCLYVPRYVAARHDPRERGGRAGGGETVGPRPSPTLPSPAAPLSPPKGRAPAATGGGKTTSTPVGMYGDRRAAVRPSRLAPRMRMSMSVSTPPCERLRPWDETWHRSGGGGGGGEGHAQWRCKHCNKRKETSAGHGGERIPTYQRRLSPLPSSPCGGGVLLLLGPDGGGGTAQHMHAYPRPTATRVGASAPAPSSTRSVGRPITTTVAVLFRPLYFFFSAPITPSPTVDCSPNTWAAVHPTRHRRRDTQAATRAHGPAHHPDKRDKRRQEKREWTSRRAQVARGREVPLAGKAKTASPCPNWTALPGQAIPW